VAISTGEEGPHATLTSDEAGRTFSLDHYIDIQGTKKSVFFETADSFGREEEDFSDFLHESDYAEKKLEI
jgi:hypothetical protein